MSQPLTLWNRRPGGPRTAGRICHPWTGGPRWSRPAPTAAGAVVLPGLRPARRNGRPRKTDCGRRNSRKLSRSMRRALRLLEEMAEAAEQAHVLGGGTSVEALTQDRLPDVPWGQPARLPKPHRPRLPVDRPGPPAHRCADPSPGIRRPGSTRPGRLSDDDHDWSPDG